MIVRLFVCLCLLVPTLLRAANVQLSVKASSVVRTVDDRHFGINATIWDSQFTNTTTKQVLRATDLRFLRFPGGSLSDEYHWATNTSLAYTWTWSISFDSFMAQVKDLGAQYIITTNYGTGTAAEAAAWVKYANVTKQYGVKYWEIGNENYGTWETDTHTVKNDPYTYAQQAALYIAAMKAEDATIKVGVVVTASEDDYATYKTHPATNPRTSVVHNGWTPVMLSTLKSLGVTPDFVVYHRYEQQPAAESDAGLLQSAKTWPTDSASIRQMLTDYLADSTGAVEMIVTENNSVSYNPGKQTTSLVNALFCADSLGQVLNTGFNGYMWWAFRNSQETGNNNSSSLYGWRNYGDYGIVGPNNELYPAYYAMKALGHFARGGDSVVQASSDNTLLSVYSCLKANGVLSLLVINKSPSATQTADITLSGYTPYPSGLLWTYGKTHDTAANTGSGFSDLESRSLTGVSARFTQAFDPYSITVINLYPSTVGGRLGNLSARAWVSNGDQSLIAGAVIGGSGASLPVLVRASGPSLTPLGVTGVLADPEMSLYTGSTVSAQNDNWGGSSTLSSLFTKVGAFSFTSSTSLDAAWQGSLAAGAWTAVVDGKSGTGVGLVEFYDATDYALNGALLMNLSARAQVGTGANVLIAGFVLQGTGPQTVLLRGVGPGLKAAPFNLSSALTTTTISLHTAIRTDDTVLATNTTWGGSSSLAAVMAKLGAFTLDTTSKDSVLLVTLAPGAYTVILSGVASETGIGLVEVYKVSDQ